MLKKILVFSFIFCALCTFMPSASNNNFEQFIMTDQFCDDLKTEKVSSADRWKLVPNECKAKAEACAKDGECLNMLLSTSALVTECEAKVRGEHSGQEGGLTSYVCPQCDELEASETMTDEEQSVFDACSEMCNECADKVIPELIIPGCANECDELLDFMVCTTGASIACNFGHDDCGKCSEVMWSCSFDATCYDNLSWLETYNEEFYLRQGDSDVLTGAYDVSTVCFNAIKRSESKGSEITACKLLDITEGYCKDIVKNPEGCSQDFLEWVQCTLFGFYECMSAS